MRIVPHVQDSCRMQHREEPADVLTDADRQATAAPLGDSVLSCRPVQRNVPHAPNDWRLGSLDIGSYAGSTAFNLGLSRRPVLWWARANRVVPPHIVNEVEQRGSHAPTKEP